MDEIKLYRDFMKCPYCRWDDDTPPSDEEKGVDFPAPGKAAAGELIELPVFESAAEDSYSALLDTRRSERVFADEPITREQLAFLLWSAQGVQRIAGGGRATLRPAPSGGARHPFELYAVVKNVEGLKPGLYRYLPLETPGEKRVLIERLGDFAEYENRVGDLLLGQSWAEKAPVVLFFSCVPYRAEWRYGTSAHHVMLIDLGHAGQNVMLSVAALGLGSCCIAAYNQDLCDKALGLDGTDEYIVYAIPVGKPKT